ncbi:MAG: GHKL domain-containing protein [Lachnospiraceae bacterium]|nr:GHKL domain-containing protein [Lachnospiraceae bacterium]
MENIAVYWDKASTIMTVLNLIIEAWVIYYFIRPFTNKKSYLAGISFTLSMLVFYFVPYEIRYARLLGMIVVFVVMCLVDRRNIKQKVFLTTSLYLFRWVAYGVALFLRDIMFDLFINTQYMLTRPMVQVGVYVLVEMIYYTVVLLLLLVVIKKVHKVYVNKREDMSGKELLLILAILSTVLVGYFSFTFFSDVYLKDTEVYIWNVHPQYQVLYTMYQLVSFATMYITIVFYQRMKEKQREEKESILLAEQINNMEKHISEVEKLYGDIRGLKHDMGNHISVLESLFIKGEKEEFENYLRELKIHWNESVSEIKTGNPVTDVILTQHKQEAEENGIDFRCNFIYPTDTKINAFDVSVILNNAIVNAMEGVADCKKSYIKVASYRKKNAYMIEIENSISKKVNLDEETGLPRTSKKDRGNHGFGLINIRNVAQQYFGDVDIIQDGNSFKLVVMLMVE